MITEDYVSLETAKLLKEKGFEGDTSCYYTKDNSKRWVYQHYHDFDKKDRIECPTLQMVMKWLRNTYNLFINVDWDSENFYFVIITDMIKGDYVKADISGNEYKSYEEAAEAAIKYCLKKFDLSMTKEIEIPEGYEAKIDGNKVILVPKESEDERIRKELLEEIEFIIPHDDETDSEGLILPSYHARIDRYKSYLEKQKEQKSTKWDNKDLPQGGEPIMINRILHSLRLYREMLKDSNFEEDYIKATLNNCLEDEKWLMSLEVSQKPVE